MKAFAITILVFATATLVFAKDNARSKEELIADDLEKLSGTWEVISVLIDGRDKPESVGYKFAFSNSTIAAGKEPGFEKDTSEFSIDPTKSPKQIDVFKKVKGKESRGYGIYSFDGDKLIWCMSGDDARPISFVADKQSTHAHWILKKVSNEKNQK